MTYDDFVLVFVTKKEKEQIDTLAEKEDIPTFEFCYNILKEKLGDIKNGTVVS